MNDIIINNTKVKDNIVIKKFNDNIINLYNFFETVNFDNYPEIIDYDNDNIRYKYIDSKSYHERVKGEELIKTIANLHYKTLFYKDVSKNDYKKIYDILENNIIYLQKYYEDIINKIEDEVFMSPSNYYIARNYSIIIESLKYAYDKLKKWYKIVENKLTQRVCTVHNNLSFEHFIKGDKNYLISFDRAVVDTPILDLYKFYKKEGYKLPFNNLLEIYNNELKLLEEEKILFNILISLPPKIEKIDNEYYNILNIKNNFDYIYASLKVIKENK